MLRCTHSRGALRRRSAAVLRLEVLCVQSDCKKDKRLWHALCACA